MLEVRELTARELFRAQQAKLQGQLRLDISSGCFPADTDQPLDVLCARVAIGERLVRMLQGCAVEAQLSVNDRAGFEPDAVPPGPPSCGRLCVMASPTRFEAFVLYRLNREFGLDRHSSCYPPAIECLATDCYSWGGTPDAAREDFELDAGHKQLFIRCKRSHERVAPLGKAEQVWRLPSGN